MNKLKSFLSKKISYIMSAFFIGTALLNPINTYATEITDYQAAAEARLLLPVQSNEIANWPEGPSIEAEAAIVMEANTGTILYAKNIHEELYPASTTKILTCLLAAENAPLTDMVTFSYEAVHSVPSDGSNMGIDAGESMTLEQCLYGIMVGSANEAANAVAEHVSGSIEAFVDLMNQKAAELGCTNSHFNNTNGLQDENHYTSVYDLALISKEFFNTDALSEIGNTARYHFTATATQPDDFYLNNKHKLINGEISYDGILGGKTGYTSLARETLVTCCEQDGMKLICIVFMDESPTQFTDTVTLFDYGFGNFNLVSINENENNYIPSDSSFFNLDNELFGSSTSILEFEDNSYVVLPKGSSLSDCESVVSYNVPEGKGHVAAINYTYNDAPVGMVYVDATTNDSSYNFTSLNGASDTEDNSNSTSADTIYLNVKLILIFTIVAAALLIIIIYIHSLVTSYSFAAQRRDKKRMRKRKREAKKGRMRFRD
ncbi:MAG: serine hydrolase [Butyrivibrio sp.]|nr:serine hydrolase [Butyrivibrio sp.]